MNVARSAACDGRKPFDSNFARMKESMGVRIQLWSLTDGIEVRTNGRNDHQFSCRSCAPNGDARIKFQLSKTAEPAEILSKQRIFHPMAGFHSAPASPPPRIGEGGWGVRFPRIILLADN